MRAHRSAHGTLALLLKRGQCSEAPCARLGPWLQARHKGESHAARLGHVRPAAEPREADGCVRALEISARRGAHGCRHNRPELRLAVCEAGRLESVEPASVAERVEPRLGGSLCRRRSAVLEKGERLV